MEGFEFYKDLGSSYLMIFPNGYIIVMVNESRHNANNETIISVNTRTVTPLKQSDYAFIKSLKKNWLEISREEYYGAMSLQVLPQDFQRN